MNSVIYKTGLIFVLATTLLACGGSSSTNEQSSDNTIIKTESKVTTADLVTTADFNFATVSTQTVDIDVSENSTSDAIVSICKDFSNEAGAISINYDSCPIKGRLNNGILNSSVVVANDVDEMVIEIRWFNDINKPIHYFWSPKLEETKIIR